MKKEVLVFVIQNDDDYWVVLNGIFMWVSGKGRRIWLEDGDRIGWKNAVAEVINCQDCGGLCVSASPEVLKAFGVS